MADSYHIIEGKVVPYSGGRKCNDTDAWRDATPLELQLQEQLAEYEHATAAKDAEIEALLAEVREAREFRDKMANAIGNDQLRRFIEKHGEPVPLTIRMQEAEARADKLRAEVERVTCELMDATTRADKLAEALRLIASPQRPDGSWNRDREACRQIAAEVLRDHDQEGK